jgi:hypothetical protein
LLSRCIDNQIESALVLSPSPVACRTFVRTIPFSHLLSAQKKTGKAQTQFLLCLDPPEYRKSRLEDAAAPETQQ